ncbi:MAG: tetratricopeptide repeat protein [Micrococcaceae bacterium]
MEKIATPSFVFYVKDSQAPQMIELSKKVPVVIDLWAQWCAPCRKLSPILDSLVEEYEGKIALVKIDVDKNYGAAQAFNAQSIPTVSGLIDGRPVQMFVGALPKAQIKQYFDELLKLAKQHTVTGELEKDENAKPFFEDNEDSEMAAARDAMMKNKPAEAEEIYTKKLDNDPANAEAKSGLAMVKLLKRTKDFNAPEVREKAAQANDDVQTQLDVSDLDMLGGHVEDAFNRLLNIIEIATGDDKEQVRTRLLEYFDVVGADDPRVVKARKSLARSLF